MLRIRTVAAMERSLSRLAGEGRGEGALRIAVNVT